MPGEALRSGRSAAFSLLIAAAILPRVAGSASAQGMPVGLGANKEPIEIQADSGIEWNQDAQDYVARGNAVATRGNTQVHADTLTAYYRRTKGAGSTTPAAGAGASPGSSTEIYRMDADGHVVIKGPTQTVIGDHAIYDVDRGVVVVTGHDLKLTTPQDVVTARDSLEWYDQKQIAVARGNALAVHGDRRIRADVLTAYMTKANQDQKNPAQTAPAAAVKTVAAKRGRTPGPMQSEENSRIRRIDAEGNVVVTTPTDVGRGDYGVYTARTGIVTLLGNVTITRGQDTIHGQYAVVDLNRNISRMMSLPGTGGGPGRVQALFVQQGASQKSTAPVKKP